MADNVTIPGINDLVTAFSDAPSVVATELKIASTAVLLLYIADLKEYPAERAESGYIRTKTLGRTWAAAQPAWTPVASGFEARMLNATPYAGEVQGERLQAKVHQGYWQTDEQIIEHRRSDAATYFNKASEKITRRLMGKNES